jgi:hypothetical protein
VVGGAVYVKSFVDRATLSYGIAMLEDSLLVGEKSYRHEYHVLSSNYTVGAILAGSALGFGSVATFAKNRIGWRRVIGYRFNDSGQVVFCKWKLASIIGFMTQPIAIDAFTFIQNGKNPLHSSLFAVNTISQVINSVFLAEVFSARRMGSIIQKIGTSSLVSLLLNFYSQGLLSVLKKGDIDPKITQFQLIGRGVIASAEQLVIVPMLAAVRMNHPLLATTLEQVNGTRGSYFNSHIRIHYVEDDMDFLSAYVRAIKTSLHWSVADDIVLSNEELAAAHEILRAYVKDNPGSLPKEQIYGRLVLGQKINESLL